MGVQANHVLVCGVWGKFWTHLCHGPYLVQLSLQMSYKSVLLSCCSQILFSEDSQPGQWFYQGTQALESGFVGRKNRKIAEAQHVARSTNDQCHPWGAHTCKASSPAATWLSLFSIKHGAFTVCGLRRGLGVLFTHIYILHDLGIDCKCLFFFFFLALGADHLFSLKLLWDWQQQGSLREAGTRPHPSLCPVPSKQDSPYAHYDPKARLSRCSVFAKSKFPKGKLCELLESLTLNMNFHSLIF